MPTRPLQVSLTPEQYSALDVAARRSGRSMAAVVRDLIDAHLRASAPPTDLSDLVGAVELGRPVDLAANRDDMLEHALGALG